MTNEEIGIPEYTVRKKPKKKKTVYVKCESLKQLERDYKAWYYAGRHVPEHMWMDSKYMDNNSNSLTKSIIAFLTLNGHFAARVNSQGTYSVKLGMFIRSGSTAGMADINAVIFGRSISIEVKFGKDKQSIVQKDIQKRINESGGVYFIAKTYDGFLEQIAQYI